MDDDNELNDEPSTLNMLAEKIMHQPIKLGNLAYCPTMDLIALATIDEQVHVYRLNGQRVFGVSNKQDERSVLSLQWKPDGQVLAVAFSDSSVVLVSARTGKAVHQIQYRDNSSTKICCLSWGANLTDATGTRVRLDNLLERASLDDIFNHGSQGQDAQTQLDLPTELAFLDIEAILPKLSVLPARDKDDEVFSSRASLDAMIQSLKQNQDDLADVLLVGCQDGTLHLSIYDFFKVGTFDTRHITPDLHNSRLFLHNSHPLCSTHSLLVSSLSQGLQDLCFVPFDLRLIPETGRHLSVLASKSTQLQNVLRYTGEVQLQLYSIFNASQELPHKFIRNVEEALQEENQCGFVIAAYHLAVTGNCYPCMKEWLVEELGERGHKRWDKAVTSGYESIRRLVHENLLPALQRFSVLVSRLRGLSRFQESITNLGLVTKELDQIFDTMSCLLLLARFIMISADSELRQFSAFSVWIKQEIEAQGTRLSSTSEESPERELMLDYAKILQYIQGAMLKSQLIELFAIQPETDLRSAWNPIDEDVMIYESYKKDVKAFVQGNLPDKKFPGLKGLLTRLDEQCKVVFDRIAEAQKRKVRFGQPVPLGRGDLICADMRMVIEGDKEHRGECTTYITTVAAGAPNRLKLYRIVLKVVNGISSKESIQHAVISLPTGTVKDMKYIDDEKLMVAFSKSASTSHLLSFSYRHDSELLSDISYTTLKHGTDADSAHQPSGDAYLDLSELEEMTRYIQHTFPDGPSWTPQRLAVNGRKGRRAACVVSEDRIHYRIFDVDAPVEDAEVVAEGQDAGGEMEV